MKLNFREFGVEGSPVLVVLHGLLGASRNWVSVGEDLGRAGFHVFALDLRNHGKSEWSGEMGFGVMTEDIVGWLDERGLDRVFLMGHSMGGKLAMRVACRFPERVEGLVVVDILPRDYGAGFRGEFGAMRRLKLEGLKSRGEAEERLGVEVPSLGMRRFLLTNLERGEDGGWRWLVNLEVLERSLGDLERNPLKEGDVFEGRVLFLLGEESDYVGEVDLELVKRYFPRGEMVMIGKAGHNPHADNRGEFVRVLGKWLKD